MGHGNINVEKTVAEMDGKKGKNTTNRSIRMPTVLAAQALDEAIELVKNEPKLREVLLNEENGESTTVTNGMALELLIGWATEQISVKGFGTGEAKFANQPYRYIDAQNTNMMNSIRNAFINCDSGIEAFQKRCSDQLKIVSDNMALAKAEFESRHDGDATYIKTLETANAELWESKTALSKENETLSSLTDAHEEIAEVWEKEREGLNERIVQMKDTSEENVHLLKDQQKYKAQIANLTKKMNEQTHQHQLATKEAEIGFQKTLATDTANAATEAEQKLRHTLDPVVSDLKTQVSSLTEQIKTERIDAQAHVKAVRAEEKGAADEQIKRLQEIIKNEMLNVHSAQALAFKAGGQKKKKKSRPNKAETEK